jgi:DNA-binding GntR family transcriptional regulator
MTFIQNHIPLYLKLYWKLKDKILFREWMPGERMPTVQELHEQYSVSQSTVHKALALLEEEGLIVKKRAHGIYVKDNVMAQQWDPVFTPESFKAEMQTFSLGQVSEGWVKATVNLKNIFSGQEDVFRQNRIYRWQTLMTHKQEPRRKIFLSAFLPSWLISSIQRISGTDYALNGLIEFGNYRAERIMRITRPWICDAEIAQKLEILEGTALFRRLLLYYTKEDRLMACCDYIATAHATYKETRINWDEA